jgi:hypothetical protein
MEAYLDEWLKAVKPNLREGATTAEARSSSTSSITSATHGCHHHTR